MKRTSLRNITRFTYEFTSFQGWRVAVCRQQKSFIRYFSDRQYGGRDAALEAALAVRNLLLEELRLYPNEPMVAFEHCRTAGPPKLYPSGIGPQRGEQATLPHGGQVVS